MPVKDKEQKLAPNNELIEVEVSKRVLWIGGDAYPLQNIARAQTRKLEPRHGTPIKSYIKTVVRWLILGIVATVAMAILDVHNSSLSGLIWLVVLALLVISSIKLARALREERKKVPYYTLVIETAGTPRTLLASTDGSQIRELVGAIMSAIDNPDVYYHQQIMNHYGDIIRQYGDQNVGKMVSS